ncbi:MAG: SDR family oxidoreductase [Chthoniobacterales bacterium]|nr:SDR family oxidoreductase [Chthoniobacterales bacterium]
MAGRGRTIVITGISRGCGRALAEHYLAEGHRVAGCARSQDVVDELRAEHGPLHHFSAVDVSDDEAVRVWACDVLAHFGAPDLLVNNAAVMAENAPLWDIPAPEFDAVIDTNIKGTAHVLRHYLPAMIHRGSGVVVNFSSGWGRSTSPEVAAYCASKWAIEGLTQALAQELPKGLPAVALNPGIINTDMLRSCFGKDGAARYPTADQWAKAAGPYLLDLGPKDNGRALTVPGMPSE